MGTVGAQGRSSEKMTETDSRLFVRPNAADSDHISRLYVLFASMGIQFLLRSSENKNVYYKLNRKSLNLIIS